LPLINKYEVCLQSHHCFSQYAGQLNAPAIVDKPTQDTDRYLQWALGVGGLIGVAAFASLCWMLWQTQQYSDDAITNRILKAIENGKGLEAFDQGFICITSRADSKKWDHTIA